MDSSVLTRSCARDSVLAGMLMRSDGDRCQGIDSVYAFPLLNDGLTV